MKSVSIVLLKPEALSSSSRKAFLIRKETADMLDVSLATLYLWEKAGILKPERIGRRVLYTIEVARKAVTKEKANEQLSSLK